MRSKVFHKLFLPVVLSLMVIAITVPVLVAGAQPAERTTAALGSWTQIWADEFNGSGGVNTANWLYDIGTSYPGGAANWGTGEIETMTNSTNNVFQSGGSLNIRALHSGSDPLSGWTSGRIETQRTDFQPPSGGGLAVEARIQLPNVSGAAAQGYWPAFWMLGAPFRGNYQNWPSVGEIDILEAINGVNTVYATLHCGTSPGGPCNETSGISGNTSVTAWGQWHTYRMEFDKSVSPQELRFYIDGSRFHTVRSDQVDATTWNDATNHGFFVILNVAIGGGWPGNPTSSTVSGGTMLIDYVRIYTASGGSSNPTPTPTPVSGGSNLALNRPVTASSTENNSYPAGNAVDGSTSTRWSSAFSDPQWLRVDLGSTQTINRVVLRWETAYGRDFQIQTSNDGNNWTTIRTVSGNTSTTNDLSVSSSGRYIRMYGTARATQWGYSLYEFEVYGSGSIAPTPTPTSVPAPTSTPSSGGRDAYSTIEAESYNTQSGTQTEATSDTGGGLNVGWIANGDWLRYDNVNFGSSSPITVQARLASGVSGGASGLVEFHLDSRTGPTIATIAIGNTGGWQSWTTVPMNTSSVTGTRTVYIVFASGQSSDFVNINWFYFTR